MRRRLDLDDRELLGECEIHLHRTGGPGGQHRNKVETAVRLVHRPSGLVVSAGETRSQHENKANACRRLREALAVEFRVPPPETLVWPATVRIQGARLRISSENVGFHNALAMILDVFESCDGRPAESAAVLGVTSSSLTRFLADHPRAWVAANQIRTRKNLSPLRPPSR